MSPEGKFDRIEYDMEKQRNNDRVEELHHQIQLIEKERTRIRGMLLKYEEENKILIKESEEMKIENIELKK